MEVKINDWNSFFIPIPGHKNEKENNYLQRVQDCINCFFNTYKHPQNSKKNHFEGHFGLDALLLEDNFCYMHLDGIPYCDVKFFVETAEPFPNRAGIHAVCHRDDKSKREPMIQFVLEKWKEFDYKF